MSDKHLFSSDNFYVGSDNVQCPTFILSTEELILTHTIALVQKLGQSVQKLALLRT